MNAYQASHEKDTKHLVDYFDCFPSTFSGFKELFGYEEQVGRVKVAPLYDGSHRHVLVMLPKTAEQVGKERLVEKLVGIGIGGQWQADAVNYLQEVIRGYATSDAILLLAVLDRRSGEEIDSFWRFYFSGPHGFDRSRNGGICPASDRSQACERLRKLR